MDLQPGGALSSAEGSEGPAYFTYLFIYLKRGTFGSQEGLILKVLPLWFSKFPPDTLHIFPSLEEVARRERSSQGFTWSLRRSSRGAAGWVPYSGAPGHSGVGDLKGATHTSWIFIFNPPSPCFFLSSPWLKSQIWVEGWSDWMKTLCHVGFGAPNAPRVAEGVDRVRRWGRGSIVGGIRTLWVGQLTLSVAVNIAGSFFFFNYKES